MSLRIGNTKNLFFMLKLSVIVFLLSVIAAKSDAQNRKWRHAKFKKKWSKNLSQKVYDPLRGFYVDNQNQIYVSDFGDNTIKLFDENGNFIRAFGKHKGAGPGEVQNPVGFDVDSNGNIWIADPQNSRIVVFQNDGSFVRDIPIKVIPYRIAVQPGGDSFCVIDQNASPEGEFSIFSKKGKMLQQFGTGIIKNQMKNHIVLAGEIAVSKDGDYYYTPDYAGLLLGFGSNGIKVFSKEGINPVPFPKVRFNSQGGSWVDRKARRISHGIFSASNKRIVVFSYTYVSPHAARQSLDFYNQDSGTYLYSMKLPEPTFQVYLKDGILYTLRSTKSKNILTTWRVIVPK